MPIDPIGHVDTVEKHTDTKVHGDTKVPHIDTPASHTDGPVHTDTKGIHIDAILRGEPGTGGTKAS
jgi:hypothetical protein